MQKKKRLSFIIAVMMVFAIFCAVPSATAASQLSDVSGHWAEIQIQCVVDQGIATGYPDQTFKPTNAITRAEFITMANRAFSFTETADINYSDVAAGDWYATEI
ncbi:MAG TPA: S-layer homology domain-containing protein, partial [Syntrophomonas sp.]|nr:S-layer homology domain-containing protein [Syntrophomonas sp.]